MTRVRCCSATSRIADNVVIHCDSFPPRLAADDHIAICLNNVCRHSNRLMRTASIYGGPQVPTFVQRPGIPHLHHNHTPLLFSL